MKPPEVPRPRDDLEHHPDAQIAKAVFDLVASEPFQAQLARIEATVGPDQAQAFRSLCEQAIFQQHLALNAAVITGLPAAAEAFLADPNNPPVIAATFFGSDEPGQAEAGPTPPSDPV